MPCGTPGSEDGSAECPGSCWASLWAEGYARQGVQSKSGRKEEGVTNREFLILFPIVLLTAAANIVGATCSVALLYRRSARMPQTAPTMAATAATNETMSMTRNCQSERLDVRCSSPSVSSATSAKCAGCSRRDLATRSESLGSGMGGE